jgi:hypothetical protein
MKTLALILALSGAQPLPVTKAQACFGLPPLVMPNCRAVCLCDNFGMNCAWRVACN